MEINGVGKRLGSVATFLEVECSKIFVDKVANDYGLLVEYDHKELTIYYNSDKTHLETESRKNIENDNLVIFLMRQKQGEEWFHMMCPYWYINKNYIIFEEGFRP